MIITNRKYFIDLLKTFAILLVIFGHIIQQFQPNNYKENIMFTIIYSFHMPLFMLLSGYFFEDKLENIQNLQNLVVIFKNKFMQLILPIILWTIIIVVCEYLIYQRMDFFVNEFISSFWFLRCLFLCIVLASIGKCVCKSNTICFILLTLVISHVGSVFTTYNVSGLYPSFLLGFLLKKIDGRLTTNKLRIVTCVFSILFIIMLIPFDYSYIEYLSFNLYHYFIIGEEYTLYNGYLESYKLIIGLLGGTLFFCIFKLFFERSFVSNGWQRISKIGQQTLAIYII